MDRHAGRVIIQRWTWLAFCRKLFLGYNISRIDLKEGMTMQEKKVFHVNGYLGLIVAIAVAVLGVWLCYRGRWSAAWRTGSRGRLDPAVCTVRFSIDDRTA